MSIDVLINFTFDNPIEEVKNTQSGNSICKLPHKLSNPPWMNDLSQYTHGCLFLYRRTRDVMWRSRCRGSPAARACDLIAGRPGRRCSSHPGGRSCRRASFSDVNGHPFLSPGRFSSQSWRSAPGVSPLLACLGQTWHTARLAMLATCVYLSDGTYFICFLIIYLAIVVGALHSTPSSWLVFW